MGIPIGIGCISRGVRPPGRLRWIIQTNIANLAGVPSIVYGILGLALFVRGIWNQGTGPGAACSRAC